MNIIQRLIPASNTETRPGLKMDPKYITIHETDNTSIGADAEAHARLQERGNTRTASWHLQVDDHEIIQSIPFDEVAWAAGDGRDGPGNRTSIHIEMCVNADGNYEQTVTNTVEVVKYLMNLFNIAIDHVVPHKHWTGKNCPRNLLPRWDDFIKRCQIADGWVKPGAQWFFYKNGQKQTGWIKDKSKWYFLDTNSVMQIGWVNVDSKWYFLDENGVMQTGWKKVKNKWYYMANDGSMQTGWIKLDSKWYFLKPNGEMAIGWIQDDNKWYYMANDGSMQTGWIKLDSKWYFLKPNGEMAIGWIQDDNKWYYLDYPNGVMITGTHVISGVEYTFGTDGALIEKEETQEPPPNGGVAETSATTNQTGDTSSELDIPFGSQNTNTTNEEPAP